MIRYIVTPATHNDDRYAVSADLFSAIREATSTHLMIRNKTGYGMMRLCALIVGIDENGHVAEYRDERGQMIAFVNPFTGHVEFDDPF